MFGRKKRNREGPNDEVIAEGIKKSKDQLSESELMLVEAHKAASILKQIRQENHIVRDLREVLGGQG